jgi:hypothetical protein
VEFFTPIPPEAASSHAMALIVSSQAPLLLLDDELTVIAASNSFCRVFQIDPAGANGVKLVALGAGEWNVPQLESLLKATIAGDAAIDAYEMDLIREGKKPCRLVLSAHKLDYFDADKIRIVLAVTDVTAARLAEKLKDELSGRSRCCSRNSSIASPTASRSLPACSCRAPERCSRTRRGRISTMRITG